MIEGQFSRTAISVAGLRAAHQIVDGAAVFVDPLAACILGDDLDAALAAGREPARRRLRLFVALRSRIAEEIARRAIARGVRQIVVLGAGLDTFGYRVEPTDELRVFEIDHPATQAEKRRRLEVAAIPVPPHLVFSPVDFERHTLALALGASGFEPSRSATFLWLGVTPYLTPVAVAATLQFVAGLPGGAEIVFDYVNPPASLEVGEARSFHERLAARVESLGERFQGFFDTAELHGSLASLGFDQIEDFGPREIRERLSPGSPSGEENGGHILHTARRPRDDRSA